MTKAVIEITGDASGLTAAVNQANGQLNTLTQQVQKASQDMADGFGRLRSVGLQVMAALGLADLAKQSLDASMKLEKMATTLRFASGSADEAAKNNEFLRRTVKELGLDLASAGDAFAKLAAAARGTKLEGEGARSVFDAVARASTAMGLSAEQTEGALLAVQQMMSKGKVQSEELRGQLGERLPGAFQIAARAMGVTTEELDKLLEKGMVPAAEFLPRFAAQLRVELGDAAAQAANSLQAALNRMQSAKLEAVAAMQNADLTKAFLGGLTQALETVPAVLQQSKLDIRAWADEIAMIFAALADVVTLPGRAISNIVDDIGSAVARFQFFQEGRAASMRGDREGLRRAQEMAASIQGGNRSMTPFADQLRLGRQLGEQAMGPGRADYQAQLAANQRARDLALLATKPTLGSGDGDKDKRDAARNALEALEAERRVLEEAYAATVKFYEAQQKAADNAKTLADKILRETNPALADYNQRVADIAAALEYEKLTQEEANDAFERAGMAAMAATDPMKAYREQLKTVAAGFSEIRTPAEEYARTIERIELLVREGMMTDEQADRQRRKAWRDFSETVKDAKDATQKSVDIAKDFGATFSSAFEDAVLKGRALRDVLQGILQDIARILLRQMVTNPLAGAVQAGMSTLTTAGYNAFSATGATAAQQAAVADWSFYGDQAYAAGVAGSRAVGGYVEGGSLYRVNESGMEAFRPSGSGEIIPLGRGGKTTVNVYNQPGQSAEVRERQGQNGNEIDIIIQRVEAGIARNVQRGQGIAPTLERQYALNRAAGAFR